MRPASRFIVPAAGLLTFALFGVLYDQARGTYTRVLTAMIRIPWSRPFVDWEAVSSSIRCAKAGVNIFIDNPCYTAWANAPSNYSPLWLYATFIPSGPAWDNAIPLAFCVLFFLSLALLAPPRSGGDLAVTLLATISSATAFEIERGNADVLMFLMVILGAVLATRPLAFRLPGYALFTLAGLLKFYPMVALALALRERFAVFLAVALAASGALILLVLSHYQDLVLMVHNLPKPSYYVLQFGAANLPAGLGEIAYAVLTKRLHADPALAATARGWISLVLRPALMVLAVFVAIRISAGWRLRDAVGGWAPRQAGFVVVGAAIICGCFFAGQNVVYRGIYLLLALPGLLVLAHDLPDPRARRAFRLTSFAVAYVQWALFIQWLMQAIGLGDIPGRDATFGYVQWLGNELAWWGIVTMLLSLLAAFVAGTEQWRLLAGVRRAPARA